MNFWSQWCTSISIFLFILLLFFRRGLRIPGIFDLLFPVPLSIALLFGSSEYQPIMEHAF
jgi:hypothetical protein